MSAAAATSPATDDAERLRQFGEAIDAIRRRIEAKVGPEDLDRVRKLDRFSRAMEILGRGLIHVSFEPLGFLGGVAALWLHKQLQATEIGHTALHGCYDKLEGAGAMHSRQFSWDIPIDEESWRYGHNVAHHQYTNIAGKDPDVHFGPVRLTDHAPGKPKIWQLPFTLLVIWPNFTFWMNMHFTGLSDLLHRGRLDVLEDRSLGSVAAAVKKTLRKYAPYYLKNYVFFPALAGPLFPKVLLGNWIAEVMRDVYSAATIFCGHVGERTASYPEGTRAHGRGEWYAMQVEATNNFEVPRLISILCGGLDKQIEHHMFPRLPPERLREIAPEVRAACVEHGVEYRTGSWGATLGQAFRKIAKLSTRPRAIAAVVREMM